MFAHQEDLNTEVTVEDQQDRPELSPSEAENEASSANAPADGVAEAESLATDSPQAAIPEDAGEAEENALEDAELTDPQDDRAWYVIHCYSGREHKAVSYTHLTLPTN